MSHPAETKAKRQPHQAEDQPQTKAKISFRQILGDIWDASGQGIAMVSIVTPCFPGEVAQDSWVHVLKTDNRFQNKHTTDNNPVNTFKHTKSGTHSNWECLTIASLVMFRRSSMSLPPPQLVCWAASRNLTICRSLQVESFEFLEIQAVSPSGWTVHQRLLWQTHFATCTLVVGARLECPWHKQPLS